MLQLSFNLARGMLKAHITYNTVVLDGEEIQFHNVGGRAMKLLVLVSVELMECNLCQNKVYLGNCRSMHAFLLHCGSGACQKTIIQKGKKHTMEVEWDAIYKAWQALQKLLHMSVV